MPSPTVHLPRCEGFAGGVWCPNADAKIQQGTTVDGKPHGKGTLTLTPGRGAYEVWKGVFKSGTLVRGKQTIYNGSAVTRVFKGTFQGANLHGRACEDIDYAGGLRVSKGLFFEGEPLAVTVVEDESESEFVDDNVRWNDAVERWGESMAKRVLRHAASDSRLARTAPTAKSEAESEAESVAESAAESAHEDVDELWPWQEEATKKITTSVSDRTIHWIHSTEGNVGKSFLVRFLCRHEDALLLDPDHVKDGKRHVAKKMQYTEGKFYEWPILLVDIPRARSDLVASAAFYAAVEALQSSFATQLGREAVQVVYETPPTVVVFANTPPATRLLSPDRLQVHKVDVTLTGSLLLVKDFATHEALDAFEASLRERNQRERALIDEAKQRAEAPVDMRAELVRLYQLGDQRNAQNKRKRVLLSEMHNQCRRVLGSAMPFPLQMDLEAFIDGAFRVVDVASCGGSHNPQPPEGTICKVNSKGKTGYIGFVERGGA